MDDAKAPKEEISRRSLLKGVPVVAGIVASIGAVTVPEAVAQTKLTHEVAKYQDTPKNAKSARPACNSSRPTRAKSSRVLSSRMAGASSMQRKRDRRPLGAHDDEAMALLAAKP